MKTKGQMTHALLRKLKDRYVRAREEMEEARLTYKQAQEVSPFLPEEILAHGWYAFHRTAPGQWYLETYYLSEIVADELIKQLKIVGVYGITSKFYSNNRWHYTGTFATGGHEFTVKVDGGSKPPHCRIEEIKEYKEVISYKAICEETEEEVLGR